MNAHKRGRGALMDRQGLFLRPTSPLTPSASACIRRQIHAKVEFPILRVSPAGLNHPGFVGEQLM